MAARRFVVWLLHSLGISLPSELVKQALTDGEVVYFDEPPDVKWWLWSQWLDMVVACVVVVMMVASRDGRVIALGLVGEVGILCSMAWRFATHQYTRYVLTNHRALHLSGVIRHDYEWISWKKVTDVSVHRSLLDRWFGTATIRIQSANEMSGFKQMTDVPNPVEFARVIEQRVSGSV
ncbi:MAG: PH domain-containing protein [Acidimicrobiales bacterium]